MKSFNKWRDKEDVPDSTIHIDLPSVRQQTNYSCGAACLRSICQYFKVGKMPEKEFVKQLDADADGGTAPNEIVKTARNLGLMVKAQSNMSIDTLRHYIKKKVPVICAIQAWGSPYYYGRRQSGHYVVAIGFDENNIYFMDPSIENRGFLRNEVFNKRWKDMDKHDKLWDHLGIAIWKKEENKDTQKKHDVKKIK